MGFSPQNPHLLYMAAQYLMASTDSGRDWHHASPDLTAIQRTERTDTASAAVRFRRYSPSIQSMSLSTRAAGEIWAGTSNGLVQMTRDAGQHWSNVTPAALPQRALVDAIDASHTTPGVAYFSVRAAGDWHPYIYRTTDFGKTWTDISNGLPQDQYVLSVRQDPDQANLLLVATKSTVYMSLDGGGHWQPLTLNLPTVEVTDIRFQAEQHAVVISTFGRAYWVLDDVQFLEQLAAAKVDNASPYLFKPQQTWLLKRRVGGFGSSTRTGNSGENLPAGAKVFFNLPADYAGQPVKLSFTDANGKAINSYTLPLQPKKTKAAFAKPAKVVPLHAGMNQFLWNMRYPDAVEVKGIMNTPFSASEPVGPEVLPGTYNVVLEYAGKTETQTFEVKLDPRLDTTQAGLQQRFDTLMQVHDAMGRLNTSLNAAIDARTALQGASGGKAKQAVTTLNRDIDQFVNLQIQSGEGGLVYPPRLRSWLSYISNALGEQFVAPTPAMIKVKDMFVGGANAAVKTLDADVANAKAATGK